MQNLKLTDQLLSQLGQLDGSRFSHEQAFTLAKKLTPLGWQADLDVLFSQLLQTRQMFKIQTSKQLNDLLDIMELIFSN